MSLSRSKCQISPSIEKKDRDWLDYQIDKKQRWASYSHFVRAAIKFFRIDEPRLRKKGVL